MPKKGPKTSLAGLIFGFRQKNSREKTQNSRKKLNISAFLKTFLSILSYFSKARLSNSECRTKEKTQEKTQNSSQKLKNSAFFCPLHAEKMAKKQAWILIPSVKVLTGLEPYGLWGVGIVLMNPFSWQPYFLG